VLKEKRRVEVTRKGREEKTRGKKRRDNKKMLI
jgi:hypothetical protein